MEFGLATSATPQSHHLLPSQIIYNSLTVTRKQLNDATEQLAVESDEDTFIVHPAPGDASQLANWTGPINGSAPRSNICKLSLPDPVRRGDPRAPRVPERYPVGEQDLSACTAPVHGAAVPRATRPC
ncbi:unnamed protein product [Cyclocybe aegerita]|uniref:Uncharacterized protein n=1 Tax=Cyclocybe aegerita TaxID=1973307 RepID=A0A8S0VSN2_CYCAE|nr:unnamed protein product [Cyclocybe aegerita]